MIKEDERKVTKPTYQRFEKWPREYAAEIVDIKTREARRASLSLVPEKYREMTRVYVEMFFRAKLK